MNRPASATALAAETPLITPLAHDALSARLIEEAGFKAFTIGGSALLAARHAYPDIGLIGLTDMVDGIRDIAAASRLPFLADADDGYGDVKSVARTVAAYEAIGVGGFLIEDQDRDRKQQRADKAAAVADEAVIEAKLRAALAARTNPETFIIGRTDAYGPLGLDAAMRRAERFLALGVDGIFIAGLRTEDDYRRVGAAFKGSYPVAPRCSRAAIRPGWRRPSSARWASPRFPFRPACCFASSPRCATGSRPCAGMPTASSRLQAMADGGIGARDARPGRRSRAVAGDRNGATPAEPARKLADARRAGPHRRVGS